MAQIGVDIGGYTFDKVAKTITFTGVTIDDIEQIKPIIDGDASGSADTVIFNPAKEDAAKFGTLAANVLTLNFNTNTASYANTDKLYICANLPDVDSILYYIKDGSKTSVTIDTVTPANNDPLPTALYDEDGAQGTSANPLGISIFDATGTGAIVDLSGALEVSNLKSDKLLDAILQQVEVNQSILEELKQQTELLKSLN